MRNRRKHLLLAILCAGLAVLVALPLGAGAADEDPVAITDAPPLTWGFKTSWRNYVPEPLTSDGASVLAGAPYNLTWTFESGEYDPQTRTTRVDYSGTVHWQKYRASEVGFVPPAGYSGEPDPYVLDVTLSDPRITISRDSSVLTAVASSRDRATWQIVDYGRVPIVDLDVLGTTPTVAGGTTHWAGIGATVAEQGRAAFDGNYRVGQVVDDVAFSYQGPGGAPDFSEHWDEPGKVKLKLVQNSLFIDGEEKVSPTTLWIDRQNGLAHVAREVTVDGVRSQRLEAFSLGAMATVGAPLIAPYAEIPQPSNVVAFDSNHGRLLYRRAGETGMPRWLRFDAQAGQYQSGLLADPRLSETAFAGVNLQKLAWDPTRDQGYRVQRIVPAGVASNDYNNHEWQLITYEENADGTWLKKSFRLPNFPLGQNQKGFAEGTTIDTPKYATASDGSLIVLSAIRTSNEAANPAPATIPAAFRITLDEGAGTAEVRPFPFEVVNNPEGTFNSVQTSANGQILLIADRVVQCRIESAAAIGCDAPVDLQTVETTSPSERQLAIDPASGTVWYGGIVSQKIAAIRDGQIVGSQFFAERHPKGGAVFVGSDGFVYAQTNDGSPGEAGGSKTWGYGKFEKLGTVPTVGVQPQSQAVSLAAGEPAEAVTFSSAAVGDPAPAHQWQVRVPGSTRFVDLADETGTTLTVSAQPGMDGSEYRAIHQNAAGRVASDPATLAVEYAPQLATDAASVTVAEGADAELSVVPDANPEPIVTWQRRVGGFWQTIAGDDDNFALGGASLTVLDTNTDQTGALFRAKLVNAVGTTFSSAAKLTVSPKVAVPPGGLDLENVSLEWSGNEELQGAPPAGGSNYFSAGISKGNEATYRSVDGNVAIYQATAGGSEALASWATRAAHVAGGGGQLVRLYGGDARIEPDGSTTVRWQGSWSVNFYGGLVPFVFTDPELSVDADGDGTLSAEMSGCASSIDDPSNCVPFAPVADVTVAEFSGVVVNPSGEVEITPEYGGVEVVGDPTKPQVKTPGWGSWPQAFVSFHVQTGLAAYWYTSGSGFDAAKVAAPFTVDFQGDLPPSAPPEEKPAGGAKGGAPQGADSGEEAISIAAVKRAQMLGGRRVARLATFACADGGACKLRATRRVPVELGARRYPLTVLAPERIGAGRKAVLRLRFPKPALRALSDSKRVTVELRVSAGEQAYRVRVLLLGAGRGRALVVHVGVSKLAG